MSLGTELRAAAAELLGSDDFGKSAFLIPATTDLAAGSGWSPAESPESSSPVPIRIADTGYSITNRDDTLVEAGDKVGIISAEGLSVAPQKQDSIRIDGDDYAFVDLKPLFAGSDVVVYEYVARRGG